jgi:hypothetical protein
VTAQSGGTTAASGAPTGGTGAAARTGAQTTSNPLTGGPGPGFVARP